jgi:hypothetical protein
MMMSTGIRQRKNNAHGIGGKRDVTEGGGAGSPLLGRWARATSEERLSVLMSLAYFAIGFSPITALAFAIMGVLPLGATTLLFVLPATAAGIGLGIGFPGYGKLALKGLAIGLVAVFLYDCMRVPFILSGAWGDFIPNINMWLFDTSEPNWAVGYAWRYLGDGGFMGMAFTVAYCSLKPRLVGCRASALAFGVGIWVCLILTLILAPHGEEMLFELTSTTVSLSLLGHVIYGLSIGMVLPYFVYGKRAPEGLVGRPVVRVS